MAWNEMYFVLLSVDTDTIFYFWNGIYIYCVHLGRAEVNNTFSANILLLLFFFWTLLNYQVTWNAMYFVCLLDTGTSCIVLVVLAFDGHKWSCFFHFYWPYHQVVWDEMYFVFSCYTLTLFRFWNGLPYKRCFAALAVDWHKCTNAFWQLLSFFPPRIKWHAMRFILFCSLFLTLFLHWHYCTVLCLAFWTRASWLKRLSLPSTLSVGLEWR